MRTVLVLNPLGDDQYLKIIKSIDPTIGVNAVFHDLHKMDLPMASLILNQKKDAGYDGWYVAAQDADLIADPSGLLSSMRSSGLDIVGVIPQSELSIALADALNHHLGLPCNDMDKINLRANKFRQLRHLWRNGLVTAEPVLVETPEDITLAQKRCLLMGDYVVKPIVSAGSRDTHIVRGGSMPPSEVKFPCIAQGYLRGTEYAVDTVTHDSGETQITAIYQYERSEGQILKRATHLIRPEHSPELVKRLETAVIRSLHCLGVKVGACHTEVMVTDRTVSIIEVNFRKHGHTLSHMASLKALTSNQQYILLASMLNWSLPKQVMYAPAHDLTRFSVYRTRLDSGEPDWSELDQWPMFKVVVKHDLPEPVISTSIDTALGYINCVYDGKNSADCAQLDAIREWSQKF